MLQWGSSLGLLSNTYSIHNALGDKRNPPVFNAFIRVTFEPSDITEKIPAPLPS